METDFDLDKGQKEKEHVHCTAKGRPQLKKSAVKMEIRRKWNWEFFSEYKPLLRHLICTIFDHYLS